jgi:hypothetical protein
MFKSGAVLCAVTLSVVTLRATTALHAQQVIELEKLSKTELNGIMIAAPDDAIFELKGVRKTKAQWRSDFQAKRQQLDAAKLKAIADEQKVKFEDATKALQVEQENRIAEQNAQVAKEFDELKSR